MKGNGLQKPDVSHWSAQRSCETPSEIHYLIIDASEKACSSRSSVPTPEVVTLWSDINKISSSSIDLTSLAHIGQSCDLGSTGRWNVQKGNSYSREHLWRCVGIHFSWLFVPLWVRHLSKYRSYVSADRGSAEPTWGVSCRSRPQSVDTCII